MVIGSKSDFFGRGFLKNEKELSVLFPKYEKIVAFFLNYQPVTASGGKRR